MKRLGTRRYPQAEPSGTISAMVIGVVAQPSRMGLTIWVTLTLVLALVVKCHGHVIHNCSQIQYRPRSIRLPQELAGNVGITQSPDPVSDAGLRPLKTVGLIGTTVAGPLTSQGTKGSRMLDLGATWPPRNPSRFMMPLMMRETSWRRTGLQ